MNDKRIFQIELSYVNSWNVTCTYRTHVLAETTWEAIERALTRYRDIQPNREHYKVISNFKYEDAKVIQSLAASAMNYVQQYS